MRVITIRFLLASKQFQSLINHEENGNYFFLTHSNVERKLFILSDIVNSIK